MAHGICVLRRLRRGHLRAEAVVPRSSILTHGFPLSTSLPPSDRPAHGACSFPEELMKLVLVKLGEEDDRVYAVLTQGGEVAQAKAL